MKLKIREADTNDYESIVKLIKEVHDLHVEARPNDYKACSVPLQINDYNEMLQNLKVKVFVASYNEEGIVGYTILKRNEIKSHPIMQDKVKLHMEDLCVGRDHRRKGIGKVLFNRSLEYKVEVGADKLELNVWSFNSEAIAFYKSLGMSEKFVKFEI